jgi:galactoside O-acetyltransferase
MNMQKIKGYLFQLYVAFFSMIPTSLGIKLRYIAYKPLFKKTAGKFTIDSGVTILGFNKIALGKDISIQKNSYLYATGAELTIGNNFFLGVNSQLCATRGNIQIGDNCIIAPNCLLRPDNHRFDRTDIPIIEQGYEVGTIVIEDDIWIAANAVILKDVHIKTGSVIAAGSVVTKSFEKNSVIGGVPAKLIKLRI